MPGGETHFAPFLTSWLNRTTGEHSSSFKNELCSLIMNTDMNEPTPQYNLQTQSNCGRLLLSNP